MNKDIKGFFGGKWGYINKKGDLIIKYKYDVADIFIDGIAKVLFIERDHYDKTAYINKKGKTIWGPKVTGNDMLSTAIFMELLHEL